MPVDDDLCARITSQLPTVPVYAVKLPDGFSVTTPVIVIDRLSADEDRDIAGNLLRTSARYQFSIYSASLPTARTTRDSLKAALRGYRGGSIKACSHATDSELYETDGKYHIPVDFLISF